MNLTLILSVNSSWCIKLHLSKSTVILSCFNSTAAVGLLEINGLLELKCFHVLDLVSTQVDPISPRDVLSDVVPVPC